jgi:hypothetical protein
LELAIACPRLWKSKTMTSIAFVRLNAYTTDRSSQSGSAYSRLCGGSTGACVPTRRNLLGSIP